MNNVFYPKLAGMNIWKNRRIYVPYILTCIFNIGMFYMMFFLFASKDLESVPGGDMLKTIMMLGMIVLGIFSLIFLCYSNSFLIKRRKKEFGLYNVLGMEKRHIRRTLCWETIYVMAIGYSGGFLVGILGSKLLFLLLLKILHVPAKFGFEISRLAIAGTALWFLGIFLFTLVLNMWQIHLSNPVELLRGGNTGEREPKSKLLLVAIGLVSLGSGYYLAIFTKNPLDALFLFFVAVILVMIGTYCLFIAGSIAILKLLRWKKSYYYKTSHFISVSGMLYRMKQNAVGVANICILSTGVLLMISGTVSMYAGMEDIMTSRFPYDVTYTLTGEQTENFASVLWEYLENKAEEQGMKLSNLEGYYSLDFTVLGFNGKLEFMDYSTEAIVNRNDINLVNVSVMLLEDYNRIMGKSKTLEGEHQLLFYTDQKESVPQSISFMGESYEIKEVLEACPKKGALSVYIGDTYYLVVKDKAQMDHIYQMQRKHYGEKYASQIQYLLQTDIKGSAKEKQALETNLEDEINDLLGRELPEGGVLLTEDYKQLEYTQFYSLYGGLFFLGLFLGTLFLMGTTLIIYYKQISEGYDDRERFIIMQKVGMSKKEVHQSIQSQVLTVFFLPLVMAWIHIGAAFPMMTRLLKTLNMYNVKLFAVCTVISAAVFALVYGVIYEVTAKVYYKIVD